MALDLRRAVARRPETGQTLYVLSISTSFTFRLTIRRIAIVYGVGSGFMSGFDMAHRSTCGGNAVSRLHDNLRVISACIRRRRSAEGEPAEKTLVCPGSYSGG